MFYWQLKAAVDAKAGSRQDSQSRAGTDTPRRSSGRGGPLRPCRQRWKGLKRSGEAGTGACNHMKGDLRVQGTGGIEHPNRPVGQRTNRPLCDSAGGPALEKGSPASPSSAELTGWLLKGRAAWLPLSPDLSWFFSEGYSLGI